ncbi:bifunctional 3'-5' exonuclease/DNA polymerase [Nakamurella sp. GG22]
MDDAGRPTGPRIDVAAAAELAEWAQLDERWLWDSTATIYPDLLAAGIRVERCHDVTATERILLGRAGVFGAPSSAAAVHARATGAEVPPDPEPAAHIEPTLFEPDALDIVRSSVDPIEVLRVAVADQRERAGENRALGLLLAAESASTLAAAEMGAVGLPWRADIHQNRLTEMLGPRPAAGERPLRLVELAAEISAAFGFAVNPDSVVDLRAAFRRAGFDIDSTRSWVLKDVDHPAVPAVLHYKELARLNSANGWNWLDEWARDGRFRPEYIPGGVVSGRWATRGGGALQIPKALRRAVVADPGHRLVVADAAQLEPRVLAAISADPALQAISADIDLYTALAEDGFGGDRGSAKVAMLGAMYGATSGEAGRLVATLRRRYPAAMACVEDAARRGEAGGIVHSVLGRACPPPGAGWREVVEIGSQQDATDAERRRTDQVIRDRGRFTRNFVVQGSAADWASVWLSGLRRDLREVPGAELVFFQHDELIVHVPDGSAEEVADLTVAAAEAARRLVFPGASVLTPVRPVVVDCYASAK